MSYLITQSDIDLVRSRVQHAMLKIEILNEDDTIYDTLVGYIDDGKSSIDGESVNRRTFNVTLAPTHQSISVCEDSLLWINKEIKLYIGIKGIRDTDYHWFPQGRYIMVNSSGAYDVSKNTLTINCNDLMSKLDGTVNGQIGGASTVKISAYEEDENGNPIDNTYTIIREALITIIRDLGGVNKFIIDDIGEYDGLEQYNPNYELYRNENPRWNCLPYDLEFSCGETVSKIASDILGLYSNYDGAFDEDGVYVAKAIPSSQSDPISISNDVIQSIFISESSSLDVSGIRNICEVWGETIETDFYSEDCSSTISTIAFEGENRVCTKYAVNVEQYGDIYTNNDVIGIRLSATNSSEITAININNIGDIIVYDENTGLPIQSDSLSADTIYAFKYKKELNSDKTYSYMFYLLGQWQPHALNVLTDGTVIENGYTDADGNVLDKYSLEYFMSKYNCECVSLTTIVNSPFTVQKIGERIDVKSGNEYDNIGSDSLALARAEYENWKNCRLTDNITITTTLIPFVKEYMKISYSPVNSNDIEEYIVKNVIHNYKDGTTEITMYKFYPLYNENGERGTNEVLNKYTHKRLASYTHKQVREFL